MPPLRDFTMAMLSEDFAHEIAAAVSFFAGPLTGLPAVEADRVLAAEMLAAGVVRIVEARRGG